MWDTMRAKVVLSVFYEWVNDYRRRERESVWILIWVAEGSWMSCDEEGEEDCRTESNYPIHMIYIPITKWRIISEPNAFYTDWGKAGWAFLCVCVCVCKIFRQKTDSEKYVSVTFSKMSTILCWYSRACLSFLKSSNVCEARKY